MLEKPFCFLVNHQRQGHVGLPDRKYDIMRTTRKKMALKGLNKKEINGKTHSSLVEN